MHPLTIAGMIFLFSGFILNVFAGILYGPRIQRYIEKLGVAPSSFLYSMSGLRDYLNAKKLAKRWGHSPQFLKRFEQLEITALCLVGIGLVLLLAAELLGF